MVSLLHTDHAEGLENDTSDATITLDMEWVCRSESRYLNNLVKWPSMDRMQKQFEFDKM